MGRRYDEEVDNFKGTARKAYSKVSYGRNPVWQSADADALSWELGCRRLTPGLPYLNAVQQPNVNIVRTPISAVCEQGIRTSDGTVHELDVLICATGFDTSFSARYDIIGKNNKSLRELWKNSIPEAYMGLAISGYPNYFSKSDETLPLCKYMEDSDAPLSQRSLAPTVRLPMAL